MREILQKVAAWHTAGMDCAIATIISSTGSIPRPVGTVMAIARGGAVAGSISGGCVESDIVHIAAEVMDTGGATIRRYSISDDEAGSIGLMCGGSMEVLVQPAGPEHLPGIAMVPGAVAADQPLATATIITDGAHFSRSMVVTGNSWAGSCGNPLLDAAVVAQARLHLDAGAVTTVRMGETGDCAEADLSVMISSIARPPRMLVFGAIDFAHALIRAAKVLGYSVTLCDARPVFTTKERFPEADDVVVMWPHDYLKQTTITESTMICVLTHDPKFDVPVLEVALRSDAGYVGAMGSRRTHLDRLERLRSAGVTDSELAGLSSPIGLDLGAETPQETAISILAEIIALRRNGTGRRLAELEGPIHRSAPAPSDDHSRFQRAS
ncbi:XdhC family protein [Rhodococcus globerulus]|uniref:XdhC family protein n=1 Tax=Rhodococcus globerulus TaxID=33008 RepID=UPI000527C8BC|nr:XdhC family protein [Rhodococcus globerulus]PVX59537.1 xanthine dehydrogenase accessory factor [Rhodococcus globerulus]